jgi:hypothetical protein
MRRNVMIPLDLLDMMIDLLVRLDISTHSFDIQYDYDGVLGELKLKKWRLELHDAYTKIMQADNQLARDEAKIQYLRLKYEFDSDYEYYDHF